MVPFKYEQVSGALMAELEEKLLMGESLVLLGPRYAGKRHVMNHLQEVVKNSGERVVRLKFLSDAVIDSEREVRRLLEQAIEHGIGGNGAARRAGRHEHSIFAPLDAVSTSPHSGRPVYLFASNIDSMAHHVARRFLEGLNRRVPPGQLIVVLSGERDLSNLVRSPKGEVAFGHKYVLQNCDRAEFERHMMQYLSETNLRFKSPKHAVEKLYRLAGGNLYAMRMVLWGLLEARTRGGNHTVGVKEIPESLTFVGIPTIYGAHVFRHGTQLIACDPNCWGDLETLIKQGQVEVDPGKPAPSTLEMAGVTILHRDPEQSRAYFRFASALQKDFVTKHYDARRFGDLYAGHGDWERAFAHYAKLPSSACIRPAGVEDLAQVEGAVRSLCSSLYVEATLHPARRLDSVRNMTAIRERFTKGSQYLLGFREVSFWQRASSRSEEGWQLMSKWGRPPKEKEQRIIASFLPPQDPAPSGIWELPPQHERYRQYAIVTIINPPSVDRQIAVVLSDLERGDEISHERARLSRLMLEDLARAYSHAEEVNHLDLRHRLRERQVRIMNSIFDSLGSQGVGDVLKKAAVGLWRLGYGRALFSLVDPDGEWVRGIQEKSDDSSVSMEQHVNASLRNDDNLHAYVVHHRETVRVPDARQEPRADAFFVKKGKVRACALIPLLNPAERAIGTLHVERKDGALPTDKEVKDLEFFGKQLAVAIEQIERVNMLETSLDKIPEPMVIVDRTGRRRYANRPAAKLLGLPESWNFNPDQPPLADELTGGAGNVAELLGESLRERRRLSSHHKGIGKDPEYRGVVLTGFIEDWRRQVSGGFLHIQDFNYLRRIFEAAQIIGAASDFNSAMRQTLEAMKHLGHRWGRLYRVDDDRDPRRLISYLSYGYEHPEWARNFSEGQFMSERGQPGFIDWSCIERREPLVFCWKKGLEPGELHTTFYGLKAINTPTPGQPAPIKKRYDDFWIDFPLVTRDRVLGKVSLQCDENLRPEEFELLKVLCEVATFIVRESSNVAYEKNALREAALKTIETIGHNLVTRFGGLSPLGGRYKLLEDKYEELKPINRDYFYSLDEAVRTANRAQNLLGVIRAVKTKFDLIAHLRRALPLSMPEGKLRVTADCEELEVVADGQLLSTALLEMIQNSKDALPDPDALEVTVHVESRAPDLLPGGWVRIIVSDNGPGILPEIGDRVFEEFFTYHPDREPGTGFGLDFVSRVVKAHEGYCGVLAPPGGAELFIMISRRPREATPTGEESAHVPHTDS
jgi:signal transduction histidine kinase/GAF domain-containing protein